MRIVLATHAFYPHSVGGVERYTESCARAFQALGHDVALLATRSAADGDEPGVRFADSEWHGVPIRRLSFNLGLAPEPYRLEWDNPWVNEQILEYASLRHAQVVHFIHGGRLSMSSVPLLKAAGLVVVASALDYWFVCAVSNLKRTDGTLCDGPDWLAGECIRCVLTRPWTQQDRTASLVARAPNLALKGLGLTARALPGAKGRWSSARAQTRRLAEMRGYLAQMDAVLCPSEFVAGVLRKNGFEPANFRHLPLGVDPPGQRPLRLLPSRGPLQVGFLGRIEYAKGVHVLVEAVLSLARELPIELKISGYPENPEYLAALQARASDDRRVRFLGEAPSSAAALEPLDVLVVPSLVYEAYPLVVREAQAYGLPVVVSDIGGAGEGVQHDVDGLRFRAGDVRELARQLRRLLDEPALLAGLRANVRPPLGVEPHAEQLLTLYQDLLDAKQGGGLLAPVAKPNGAAPPSLSKSSD